jgi:hypothetical protein
MRAAIRGDFERLTERRGEQELMRLAAQRADSEPAAEEGDPEPRSSRSWLARLIAR